MIVPELNNEEISDDWDMSEVLSEELTTYCEYLQKQEGMTRKVTEEDGSEPNEYWSFMWTDKAMKLIDTELKWLSGIAHKYYPDGDVEIISHMYREE